MDSTNAGYVIKLVVEDGVSIRLTCGRVVAWFGGSGDDRLDAMVAAMSGGLLAADWSGIATEAEVDIAPLDFALARLSRLCLFVVVTRPLPVCLRRLGGFGQSVLPLVLGSCALVGIRSRRGRTSDVEPVVCCVATSVSSSSEVEWLATSSTIGNSANGCVANISPISLQNLSVSAGPVRSTPGTGVTISTAIDIF